MSTSENAPEKKVTKYERKLQRRAEEKKKEAKSLLIWKIVGIVFLAAVVGGIASFPVRNYIAKNKTIVTVDGEAIKPLEFDYMYNTVKDNYMTQYSSYLSYMGLSEGMDPASAMYSDTLTFKDYFEQLAVDQIKQNRALEKLADADGFKYDASSDYELFIKNAQESAKSAGLSLKDYLRSVFGQYASKAALKPLIEDNARVSAYYSEKYDSMIPSDSEIQDYYNENSESYDSVDYYMTTVYADLPTEPTELADEGATVAEDGTYTPSDAEKEAAMTAARVKADEAEVNILTDGELHTGELRTAVPYYVRDWLFDSERVEGDTTVLENEASSMYYVLSFSARYLKDDPTVSLRAIVAETEKGEEIMAEYESSGKTEQAFEDLVKKYTIDTSALSRGGLYEDQDISSYDQEIQDWLLSSDRKQGDVKAFTIADVYSYIVYYVGEGKPLWKANVINAMMNTKMTDYINSITENIKVEGDLNYLKVEASSTETDQTEGTAE